MPVVYLPTANDKFMLEVKNQHNETLKNATVSLTIGKKQVVVTTDHNGIVEIPLAEDDTVGNTLTVSAEGQTNKEATANMTLEAGSIDDVSTIKGQQTRLNNLGFNAGVVDGINGGRTKQAVKLFQCEYKLDIDGICGPKSQAKLKKIYQQ